MADQLRKELDHYHDDLTEIHATLRGATREDFPDKLGVNQLKSIKRHLETLKSQVDEVTFKLAMLEGDGEAKERDKQHKLRIKSLWEELTSITMDISNAVQADKLGDSLLATIEHLEKMQRDNPEKVYKEANVIVNSQMEKYRIALEEANVSRLDNLWKKFDECEEKIFSMTAAESTPPEVKEERKVHDKSSYKVSALAIPKFNGKIQNWISFWQEFEHAIHQKVDMSESVKMVYLKQSITEPGLHTTISDLGIEPGSYAAAVKLLQQRYNKPRVMHKHFCESLRDYKSSLTQKTTLTEMADKAQHLILGFTRLGKLGISEAITSIVESSMGPELREHWLNHTSSFKDTPPAEHVVEFLRMKADREDDVPTFHKHQFERNKQNKPQKKKGVVAANTPAVAPPPTVATPPAASFAGPSPSTSSTGSYNSQKQKGDYPPCKYSCPLCLERHYPFHCNIFKGYDAKQRKNHVSIHKMCQNCLKPGHAVETCRSTYRCATCNQNHNSMLHDSSVAIISPALGLASAAAIIPDGLLMTANILVTGTNGTTKTARAFIDSGSSVTLISNRLKNALALKPTGSKIAIEGVAGLGEGTQHPVVNLTISSPKNRNWEKQITAIALPKVIRDLPLRDAAITKNMPHLQGLDLADPLYYKTGPVDILIGMDVFPYVMKTERRVGPQNTPMAWDTELGWAVLGVFNDDGCSQAVSASTLVIDPIHSQPTSDQMLFHLWKAEEPQRPDTGEFSTEEQRVEDHFDLTHTYEEDEKRYRVTLPRTLGDLALGESRGRALHRAQANEKSLIKGGRFSEFQAVMNEYITLEHAVAVRPNDILTPPSQHYYMPVHAVRKESSTSTKVRAVFDASAPSASGVSLNDLLAVGPTLQPTLEKTLLRFRSYCVAISGDISKMYREILLSPVDWPLHRFLWRKEVTEPWQDYEMRRVTFGVTSSPYVAIKTLFQTAIDFGQSYPQAQKHIRESFYVDDFFGGADSEKEAMLLRRQITSIWSKGGFNIKKWRSSSSKVLASISSELQETIPEQKLLDSHSACYPKALGLVWDSRRDEMATSIDVSEAYSTTKRGIASDIAKTFDVLGWLSPVILEMKLLYRSLWQKNLGWDQQIPDDLQNQHKRWRTELSLLADIRLPRHYFQGRKPEAVTLHGFSDASCKAFSAVIYIRAVYKTGPPTSALVQSKTRVAPLVDRTIPELELCGAHILAKLLESTSKTLGIKTENISAYSDSTIVLAWLDGNPKRYKLYVSNRISKTVKSMPSEVWHYVPTASNPADCASRGIPA